MITHNIKGWFSRKDGSFYNKLVSKINNGNILEIGNYHGLSISYIIETCQLNNNTIYAVDVFTYKQFKKNIELWNAENTIKVIRKKSIRAAKLFEDNFFDLIFLDGWHEIKDIQYDIKLYWPKVKTGGILLGHDYDWDTVNLVVNHYFKNSGLRTNTKFWWIKKETLLI